MNLQQAVQPRYANGFGSRKVESISRVDNKYQSEKSNLNRVIGAGITSISQGGESDSLLRDRLMYLTTCLIGHQVDVQVKNGSIYSGIFHATNADKDFGIILKMAHLTKDVSFKGQNSGIDSVSKAPSKILIIPAHELVQVVAKDVLVTGDGLSNEIEGNSQQDIMLDSNISQSRYVDVGRELEPWMPDEDAPQLPELDNIFDSPWTGRSWDQFKVNEALFGVKSTFNEELYTTILEKGPRMKELEEEARRIAREIEVEETFDLHLAEERGVSHANIDIDEETKYSSVFRGFDDSGCVDEDVMSNSHDVETFGDSSGQGMIRSFADVASGRIGKSLEGRRASSGLISKDELHTVQFNASQEPCRSVSEISNKSMNAHCELEDDCRVHESHMDDQGRNVLIKGTISISREEDQAAKSDDLHPPSVSNGGGSEKGGVSSMTTTSTICTMVEEKTSSGDHLEDKSAKLRVSEPTNSHGQSGSSASSTSERRVATSVPSATVLSPSSSVGSLSSEKSVLNPNAKEFKPNANAKSFVPSQRPLRPASPVNDASLYFPPTMSTVPYMHGMPVGIGAGPSTGYQPVLFNLQAAAVQSQQAYYPANGLQYGQQMMLGHPRQVVHIPGYPSGRDF